ncbi:hypothetical protein KOR42_39910 [Thalassoglobus neptunius]|uniref:ArnR1-like winged helix-turn-helix domain-containing protein n=1 Tax=Thalassoglobus neptunius TaxID=1938619 RepID=A0A5C5WDN4_9PLAN|nr:hypothetical protein [Thalassoglobus neptunius]TWT48201.1 hypothetical protein KOR42_39910 [Thalassoglobus neptunius]
MSHTEIDQELRDMLQLVQTGDRWNKPGTWCCAFKTETNRKLMQLQAAGLVELIGYGNANTYQLYHITDAGRQYLESSQTGDQ